jgi:hypothetical protein
MRKYIGLMAAAALVVSLSVGVATATAGGGNSANAKLCQKGGWMNVQGSDGTQFANQDECVSFGAHGGTIVPKPTCTAGSENFSGDAEGSVPTTFAGGTIDGPYADFGQVFIQSPSGQWFGFFPDGTHMLFSGLSGAPFRLTFTEGVSSVQLDAQANTHDAETQTLTAYDSSNTVVDSDAVTAADTGSVTSLSVSSATNNINYFTVESTDSDGFGFTNIVWACA